MGIKISKKLDLKKFIPEVKKRMPSTLKSSIEDAIVDQIQSGISPVRGFNRFKKYSEKYAKQKRVSRTDVDMTLSGNMLNNQLKVTSSKGSILIRFVGKIAGYHNDGEGNNPERRLLPSKKGERFKEKIWDDVLKRVNALVKAITKKQ